MMRIKLLAELDNGGVIFPKCSVIETENSAGQALIDAGKAERVADNVPCRINPEGYDGCMPPDPVALAAKKALKAPDPAG